MLFPTGVGAGLGCSEPNDDLRASVSIAFVTDSTLSRSASITLSSKASMNSVGKTPWIGNWAGHPQSRILLGLSKRGLTNCNDTNDLDADDAAERF